MQTTDARRAAGAPTTPQVPTLTAAYAECDATLRRGDKDRWLATLFAPADKRPHLHALYAFSHEVARVREVVSDPLPGEVRYQWWRDTLEGELRGDIKAHPIAAALIDTIVRFRLPRGAFTSLVEAREFDLYDDPMPSLQQLEGYCGETSSSLVRLATLILDDGRPAGDADACGHAGVAYAMAGLLRAFPWHASRGQVYVPAEILTRHGVTPGDIAARRKPRNVAAALADLRGHARKHLQSFRASGPHSGAHAAAFLLVGLVEPQLRCMERSGNDPYAEVAELSQWRRQWLLWRTARTFGKHQKSNAK